MNEEMSMQDVINGIHEVMSNHGIDLGEDIAEYDMVIEDDQSHKKSGELFSFRIKAQSPLQAIMRLVHAHEVLYPTAKIIYLRSEVVKHEHTATL